VGAGWIHPFRYPCRIRWLCGNCVSVDTHLEVVHVIVMHQPFQTIVKGGMRMRTKEQNPVDESANGKYVVIKVPREAARKSIYSYLLADAPLEKFRIGVWVTLCGLSLLVGALLEAAFHWKLL
jgi:hypothetical protein